MASSTAARLGKSRTVCVPFRPPELTGEDALNFYFRLDREKYKKHRNILLKMYGYDIK